MSEPNPPSQPKASGPGNAAGSNPVQFNSAMSTKAGQPKDFFAEQNQKRQDEIERKRKRTKVSIILVSIILVVLVVTGVVLWILIFSKDNTTSNESDLPQQIVMQNEAQTAYEDGGRSVAAIEKYFANKIAEARSAHNETRVRELMLIKMAIFGANYYTEQVIEAAKDIDIDDLSKEQIGTYCGMLSNAYSTLGDMEKAEYYSNLAIERGAYDEVEGQG